MTSFYLEGEPHVDPAKLIAHYCASQGITEDDLGIKPVVLATFSSRLTRFIAELAGGERNERWSDWKDDAYNVGDGLSIVTFPIGAPVAVAQLEEMYVCGMRTLITTGAAGSLFGTKMVLNEFVAFLNLGTTQGLSQRSVAIITFALCGFANFSSIAIQMAATGSLAPNQRPVIARLGIKALVAGSLANLMSAALAGLLLP